MKKLLLISSVLLVSGCADYIDGQRSSNIFRFTNQGAGFSPYTVAEWQARAARGEPGLSAGSNARVTGQASVSSSNSDVTRTTAQSYRTGSGTSGKLNDSTSFFSATPVPGTASGQATSAAYKANAPRAAEQVGNQGRVVNVGGDIVLASHSQVGAYSYVVFQAQSGRFGGSKLDLKKSDAYAKAIPVLTDCASVSEPFVLGPNRRRASHLVYPVSCG